MPRVLNREQVRSTRARFADALDELPSLTPEDGEHPWFGKPAGAGERARIVQAAVPVLKSRIGADRREKYAESDSRRFLTRLLDWLDSHPGESYQDRWIAAEPDGRPYAWCPAMTDGPTHRAGARLALNALILLGVIRPSQSWLLGNKQSRFYRDWTTTHEPDAWDRYFAAAEKEHAPEAKRWGTATHLVRICIVNGLPVTKVRGLHVLAYREYLQDTNRSTGDLLAMWHYARQAGLLVGEAEELRELILAKQLTPTQLVDRHQLTAPTVRQVLIDYLTEVSTSQDYGSLVTSCGNLVGLFWKPIENANPGIDTINLTKTQAAAWKQWLPTKPDGTPRRNVDSVLGAVRSFYLDIAAWAHEDPATWANWAVSCPVSIRDVRGMSKRKAHRQHRMQARTRTLAPHIDALVTAAERRYLQALELLERTKASEFGEHFTLHGDTYVRHRPTKKAAQDTNYVTQIGRETRIDTEWLVTSRFMTWMFIEVLRHTGIRVEEMLELTHLSIKQYRKPDGTVLPLLQIAPSKTDQERILPCSPELTTALARLITFVSLDGRVPACCRRDDHERTITAPMPFLFQLREAGRSRVVSPGTVRNWLTDLTNSLSLHDTDGTLIRFTPHDFRRIFITDIVNAGFPIHLAAKLVGHNNIEVTRGYTAVYQKDVFEAYERFISHRRQARPSAEYGEPTQEEWDEFIEHFGHRKIALGNCHRPYGADCVHEHACIRCDFLQVEASQANRLDEIRTNLGAQIEEARRNQWIGDVDQLRLTIEHADRKADKLRQRLLDKPELALAQPTVDATSLSC